MNLKCVLTRSATAICVMMAISTIFAPSPVVAQEWKTLESEHFIINYLPGYESDADKILVFAEYAHEVVLSKYANASIPQKLPVYTYAEPTTIGTERFT